MTLAEFIEVLQTPPSTLTREEWLALEVKFGKPYDRESSDVEPDYDFIEPVWDEKNGRVMISIG